MRHRALPLRSFFLFLIALAGWGALALAQPQPPLKLAVIVSIDGLSWPWLSHYRPWFEFGLKRLLDEGHVETNAKYRHLNTETGPGHAKIFIVEARVGEVYTGRGQGSTKKAAAQAAAKLILDQMDGAGALKTEA